jgi:hypothetical protein
MATKSLPSAFTALISLIDSAIIEYELIYEEIVKEFSIREIRCVIKEFDLSLSNKYYIIISDFEGSHCVDWSNNLDVLQEKYEHWKRVLMLGNKEITEYSFPNIFPIRKWTLK